MVKFIKLNLFIGAIFYFTSCAMFATSMSPVEVNNTLPTFTKSKFISQSQAEKSVKTNNCKYLVKGRNYSAPMGLTVKEDLKNGAKGIDERVQLDGGNAYVLIGYKWVNVGQDGSTQLHVEFDTMLCE